MKIKKVEMKNINSLMGEWSIDFESPDFADSGMFCISGPTGSGKTSILDGISLALYGLTPRQEKINGTVNEVMSYGARECYARVTFECGGVDYTACWSQHRSRGGNLQRYSWTLTSGERTESFSDQKRIEAKMQELIGLDYGQFTKSVLLAQGEFSKFLKCNENERAAILEKLTGDEIYRKIAVAIHQIYSESQEAVEQKEKQMGENRPLSDEDRQSLDESLSACISKKDTLNREIQRLGAICSWFELLHQKEGDLAKANGELSQAQAEKQVFEPYAEKLEMALKAQEIEAAYAELCIKRESVKKSETRLEDAQVQFPLVEQKLNEAFKEKADKFQKFEELKESYTKSESVWQKVAELDSQIDSANGVAGNAESAVKKTEDELVQLQSLIKELEDQRTQKNASKAQLDSYAGSNAKDAEIESLLPLLNSKCRELQDDRKNLTAASAAFESATQKLDSFEESLKQKEEQFLQLKEYQDSNANDAQLVNILPQAKALAYEGGKCKSEIRQCEATVQENEKTILSTQGQISQQEKEIQDLIIQKKKLEEENLPVVVMELRSNLKAGEACPVCGSKEHPSCIEHGVEASSSVDALDALARNLRILNEKLDSARQNRIMLDGKIQRLQADISDAQKRGSDTQKRLEELGRDLSSQISPWHPDISFENVDSCLSELDARSETFIRNKSRYSELESERANAGVERAKLESAKNTALEKRKAAEESIQELFRWFEEQLSPWFSNVEINSIEALLLEMVKKNNNWKSVQKQIQDLAVEITGLESEIVQSKNHCEGIVTRLDSAQKFLNDALQKLQELVQKRKELFGDKIVDVERDNARGLRNNAEKEFNRAVNEAQEIQQDKSRLEAEIGEIKSELEISKPQLEQLQQLFEEKLASKQFKDEADFYGARLSEGERKTLQQRKEAIGNHLTAADASVKSAAKQLEVHQQKRDFEETEEIAGSSHSEKKNELDKVSEEYGILHAKKENDAKLQEKFRGLQQELECLKTKQERWSRMQIWFNGRQNNGTGNEFVKFIEIITLKNLLRIANIHLREMFSRYEMVVGDNSLDIMLVDHDNGDSIRPVSNISGGESFLVSLALALGISTLASKNVRIDSMFLDEGFGTLDSNILQATISVLQKMQREKGKMLGVITHVDVVKNELSTHIEVVPQGRGRSILRGAGVSSS